MSGHPRLGWTVVHDQANVYRGALSTAIHKLTIRLVGPNTIIQAAIPDILNKTPQSWQDKQQKKYLYGFYWLGQHMKEDEHKIEEKPREKLLKLLFILFIMKK